MDEGNKKASILFDTDHPTISSLPTAIQNRIIRHARLRPNAADVPTTNPRFVSKKQQVFERMGFTRSVDLKTKFTTSTTTRIIRGPHLDSASNKYPPCRSMYRRSRQGPAPGRHHPAVRRGYGFFAACRKVRRPRPHPYRTRTKPFRGGRRCPASWFC